MKYQILLLVLSFSFIQTQVTNPCLQARDCSGCLKAGGSCKWCADEGFDSGENSRRERCNEEGNLSEQKCQKMEIQDGQLVSKLDNKFDSIIQVRPQKVHLKLRPSQTEPFRIRVKPAKDFPVSLYYLMDMSKSMDDDLLKLQGLGTEIANEIGKITKNYKLAFGSFVDKTVAPFIQIQKKLPCDTCEATFGYKHVFDFNKDASQFESAVKKQKISGNLDTPEGGFDGLLQVAVCGSKLGWADIKKERRLVVFVTDASPHIAGDGKLGGITVPNDGTCHLVDGTDSTKLYSKSNELDYPSVSLLKEKLKKNKIVPIFAVTKEVIPVYQKLTEEWKDLGASIGALDTDSSNIVGLIRDSYYAIATTVRLSDDSPEDIVVRYKVDKATCKNVKDDDECADVAVGEQVDFNVQVTALNCPANWKQTRNFTITIPGFGDVEIEVDMICDCECEKKNIVENSPKCNGTGSFKCGICYCPAGKYGKVCECGSKAQADTQLCKQSNSTNSDTVCSGFGTCVCGKCECDRRENAGQRIYGRYCECNNFGCPRYHGELCGGSERGICECGKCKCKEAFLGDNCGGKNCTIGRKKCIKDDVMCGGNGKCDCDTCECDTGYEGQHCENCVSCPGKCAQTKECVFCLGFNGPKHPKRDPEVCKKCTHINYRMVNQTEEKCAQKDEDGCYVIYSFEQDLVTKNETIVIQETKKCVVFVKKDPPILAIVLGTIGGIVLLGLILLLLWKLLITAYDNYEYHKFEKDRMKSKWENAENPIYRPSKQQFQNPAYAGNK